MTIEQTEREQAEKSIWRTLQCSEAYLEAKKQPGRGWQLFYRGTRNEVFPGKLFQSAHKAYNHFRIQKKKEWESKTKGKTP